jgi:hypothetical protein
LGIKTKKALSGLISGEKEGGDLNSTKNGLGVSLSSPIIGVKRKYFSKMGGNYHEFSYWYRKYKKTYQLVCRLTIGRLCHGGSNPGL